MKKEERLKDMKQQLNELEAACSTSRHEINHYKNLIDWLTEEVNAAQDQLTVAQKRDEEREQQFKSLEDQLKQQVSLKKKKKKKKRNS